MDSHSEEVEGKVDRKENEQKNGAKTNASASKLKHAVMDMEKSKDDLGLSPEEDGDDDSTEDSSSEDDEDDRLEEETPKNTSKRRAAEISLKTLASDKKTKVATPSIQKTGDKKGIHVATPHPAKQAGKTPVNSDNEKEKSLGSGGWSIACKSCNKTFNSELALQSHSKAKHYSMK
ncbi:hypothetical protein E2562_034978 [Oryza meyeriana var. granulata]|uniref:C2H2-type domain-containing protein n=1 Tax=Oryza meyeriana var. granulata TaxID=110450 RepID=A0A6G1FF44_9ORYZ|nr:hypothetical protein E2562_034978 [Oryza meyeriana var. granulata]